MSGRRRWGDDDSDDDELTVDAVRKARAAKAGGGDQSLSQMQMQTKEVSRKALSSTQRSLKQLEQTTQMAGATLEKMHDQNAQMRRIDDDLDEMDTALTKANKQVDDLGAGFAKGFAKDVASATRPRMFGGGKKQAEKDAAARAIAEQERREKEARDARYAEERAAKSTGASHMERAAATSKFGSKGPRKKWNRPDYGEGNEEAEDNMEEVDKNLDQMGTLLTGLNSMAVDMGTQLEQSAQQIKTVSEKVDKNSEKQQKVMGKLGKIVGKKKG